MRRLLPLVLAAGLLTAAAAPVAAQPNQRAIQTALVGVLAQVALQNVDILRDADIDIITVDINNSLNNLLRNADIDVNVLNNVLNNVLRNADIDITVQDITVVGDNLVITLLGGDVVILS